MNTIGYSYLMQEKKIIFKKYELIFLSFLILSLFTQIAQGQTVSFPEAFGFGSDASGGRGGSVIKVTNLNDNGPGSFRAALGASGARTVVFEVGGTINLSDNIYITNGDLTIAGQTAPGDGVLIKGGMIQIEDSNVIVRYLRIRPGPTSNTDTDAISVTAWSGRIVENIIIDHCSFSWAKDENVNIRTTGSGIARNITVQNSIIAESGYAFLAAEGGFNISVYKNFFALNGDRHIRGKGFSNTQFAHEQINNLIFGFQRSGHVSLGARFSNIGNHYKLSSSVSFVESNLISDNDDGGIASNTYAYISENIVPAGVNEIDNGFNPYLENVPYIITNITPIAAGAVESEILVNVGSSFPVRDAVDERLVENWNNGDGNLATSGTYPTINGGTAPIDTDNDGMPDFWEDDNGLNKNDPSDRNIVQSDGYTNLEYYLNNLFFLDDDEVNANAGSDQNICAGSSTALSASGGDTYLWSTGETTQSITVTPSSTTTYTVTAYVGSESDSDDVVINVNPIPSANGGANQTICSGETISLTANGGGSYLWNTGATTQSINVSPNDTTTYSVTVTENNCSDTDDVIVTVNPGPNANAGADITIFEGETTVLTASGGDTYLWSTGGTSPSIEVNPDETTSYSVTVFEGDCEDSDSVIVNVNSNSNEEEVNAYAGEDVNICNGDIVILTASGGTDYLWSTGETTQSIEVSPEMTTNYTVIVSNETSIDTAEVTVGVSPIPELEVTDDITILEGPEYYTLSVSGADRYEWSNGATDPNISVSPNTTTTYVVTGYIDDCYDIKSITVNVEAQVHVDVGEDMSICYGNEVTLMANSSGGDSYLWNTGETTQSIVVRPEVDTVYTVIVSNTLDSEADEIMVLVESCQEEIIPEEELLFEVYTNPRNSNNILKVKLDGISNHCKLYLFDVSGKLLYSDEFIANEGQQVVKDINTSHISDGVYIMKLVEKNGTHSKNLVIY